MIARVRRLGVSEGVAVAAVAVAAGEAVAVAAGEDVAAGAGGCMRAR